LSILALSLVLVGVVPLVSFAAAEEVIRASSPAPSDADEQRELRRLQRRLQRGETLTEDELSRLMSLHYAEEEHVRMVVLPVSVTNKRGRVVRDLSKDDFRLFEDRIPQEIRYFSADRTDAIHVAFLLDLSGSMEHSGKLEAAKDAIRYFVETLRPGDRAALIGFADDQVSWITEFTDDRERFLERLAVQEGFGQTALNDAVAATPRLVDESIDGRKAIVLFTDGVDTASRMSDWDALKLARQVSVPIYTVGFTAVPEALRREGTTQLNLRLMSTFARETGGLLYAVHDPDELKEATAAIIEELRFQYLIGYYPTPREWDGRFRRIELDTGRDPWTVRTRNGYYANRQDP
jgi:Ca-activated chloride channel family protein